MKLSLVLDHWIKPQVGTIKSFERVYMLQEVTNDEGETTIGTFYSDKLKPNTIVAAKNSMSKKKTIGKLALRNEEAKKKTKTKSKKAKNAKKSKSKKAKKAKSKSKKAKKSKSKKAKKSKSKKAKTTAKKSKTKNAKKSKAATSPSKGAAALSVIYKIRTVKTNLIRVKFVIGNNGLQDAKNVMLSITIPSQNKVNKLKYFAANYCQVVNQVLTCTIPTFAVSDAHSVFF